VAKVWGKNLEKEKGRGECVRQKLNSRKGRGLSF